MPSFAAFFGGAEGPTVVPTICLSFFSGRRPDRHTEEYFSRKRVVKAAQRPWPRSGQRPRSGLQAAQRPVWSVANTVIQALLLRGLRAQAQLLSPWLDRWAGGRMGMWTDWMTTEEKRSFCCGLDEKSSVFFCRVLPHFLWGTFVTFFVRFVLHFLHLWVPGSGFWARAGSKNLFFRSKKSFFFVFLDVSSLCHFLCRIWAQIWRLYHILAPTSAYT